MQLQERIQLRYTAPLFMIMVCMAGTFLAYKIVNVPAQMEMVVAFSLVILIPVLRFPKVGVYLLFIIMPMVAFFRRLYYLQYARPSADPLLIIGDILIAVITAGLYFEFRKQKDESFPVLSRWILGYFIYLIIRVFFMNSLPMADAIMKFRFYGPAVLMFFAGMIFGRDLKMLRNIWYITIFGGVIAAFYGIKQLALGYSEFEKLWFNSISFTTLFIKGIARPFSFFQSPAAFADYMLLAIVAVIVVVTGSRKFLVKYLILSVPLFVYALLITSVRSNWIGAITIFLLWVFVIRFNKWSSRIGLISLLFLLFVSSQLIEFHFNDKREFNNIFAVINEKSNQGYFDLLVKQRVGALSNPLDEHSLLSRIALWKYIVVSTSDPVKAVLGRGVGVLGADSLYFTYLAELGYPGMAFIVIVTILLIIKGFHVMDRSSDFSVIAIARGVTIMNIAFWIINITGTHIHGFPGDIYFWFWNGVMIHYSSVLKNEALEINENTTDT